MIDTTELVARKDVIELIKERGTTPREDTIKLSGGGETDIYLDIKGVLDCGRYLARAGMAYMEWFATISKAGIVDLNDANVIGGPTMGADGLAHALVVLSAFAVGVMRKADGIPEEALRDLDKRWFSVRSEPKLDHGLGRWIEGTTLGPEDKVILVDDVASTGQSLFDAWLRVSETGAEVLAVVPLVDRADKAEKLFEPHGVPYLPILTYHDLEIPPL
jgi:orotate phosphoribosyltransferase